MSCRRVPFLNRASLVAGLLIATSPAIGADSGQESLVQLQEALLSTSVNGVDSPGPLVLLREAGDHIYASAEQLASWRIKPDGLRSILYQGRRYYLLNDIEGASVAIDDAAQALLLTVPPAKLARTRLAYAPVELSDKLASGTGAFLNYDVNVERSDSELRAGAALEAVVFTPKGVGVAGFVAQTTGRDTAFVRLDANWTIDDPDHLRSLRLGDSIARGGVGGRPVRFAGIQLARKFAMQPGFIPSPLPSLSGTAEIPSVVDVYVNNNLTRSLELPPGPFDIADIPVVTGSGEVQLIVRDMLGRQQVVSQPFYASLSQLRPGVDDYSYELGFLRRSFGQKSNDYGALMLTGTHRHGFSNSFTGEAHLEATARVQAVGVGGSLIVANVGRIEASVAGSRSDLGDGRAASFSFERRTRSVSLGVHADIASSGYMTIGASPDRPPPASVLQAFAGIPLNGSSIGLSYIHRDARGDEADAELVTANWSSRIGRVGSLSLALRKSLSGTKDTGAELSLILPLGPRTSASVSAAVDQGSPRLSAILQRNLPIGNGLGYRLSAAAGQFNRIDGKIALRTGFGDYDGQLTWTDGRTGMRLSTAGAIGLLGSEPFASRRLNQSFARVKVGHYKGVRVYADNQLVGRTGKSGNIIVPVLRPYDRNVVRIDAGDLPLDAELAVEEQTIRPYERSGVVVDFEAKPARAALIRVKLADGADLPAGSVIKVSGRNEEFVSSPGGEVYLTGLDANIVAVAEWLGGSCQFAFHPSAGPFEQTPRPVQCQAVAR